MPPILVTAKNIALLFSALSALVAIVSYIRASYKKVFPASLRFPTDEMIRPLVDCIAEYEEALYQTTIDRHRLLEMAEAYPRGACLYCTKSPNLRWVSKLLPFLRIKRSSHLWIRKIISFWPIRSESYFKILSGELDETTVSAVDLVTEPTASHQYWYIGDICTFEPPLPVALSKKNVETWTAEFKKQRESGKFSRWMRDMKSASGRLFYKRFVASSIKHWLGKTRLEGKITFVAIAASKRGVEIMQDLSFLTKDKQLPQDEGDVGILEFAGVGDLREFVDQHMACVFGHKEGA